MAVKIVRQPNQIVLLGVPSSAAGNAPGHEKGPQALRAAGLVERLQQIGFQVTDFGDDPPQVFQTDEESPRARNLPVILKVLEALRPRVEGAVKSRALPLILGGDCSIAIATVAGMRRYFRSVGVIYMDADADLNTPATTSSGLVDGMVVAHLTGRGAAEMVRFWGEPPLVRDPEMVLFGVSRLDPAEEQLLQRAPIRRFLADDMRRIGAAEAARVAVERIHAPNNEFLLHLDPDVISSSEYRATSFPGAAGLSLEEVRRALEVFVSQPHLAAIEVTTYNPDLDPDGSDARKLVDLLSGALEVRLRALSSTAGVASATPSAPTTTVGEAWSADSGDENAEPPTGPSDA